MKTIKKAGQLFIPNGISNMSSQTSYQYLRFVLMVLMYANCNKMLQIKISGMHLTEIERIYCNIVMCNAVRQSYRYKINIINLLHEMEDQRTCRVYRKKATLT